MLTPTRLLVVEDEPGMRDALGSGLRAGGFTVDLSSTAQQGLELARNERFDLVLLDVMLPDGNGTALCQQLRDGGVDCPVIMLTALGDTHHKLGGFAAGADDYVTKPFVFPELVARIHAVLRRRGQQSPRLLTYDELSLDLITRRARRGSREVELSNKEFQLLCILLRNTDRTLTRQQIGQQVWNVHFDPRGNVIEVYIAMLRKHIDRGFDVALIRTVRGVGYRISNHDDPDETS